MKAFKGVVWNKIEHDQFSVPAVAVAAAGAQQTQIVSSRMEMYSGKFISRMMVSKMFQDLGQAEAKKKTRSRVLFEVPLEIDCENRTALLPLSFCERCLPDKNAYMELTTTGARTKGRFNNNPLPPPLLLSSCLYPTPHSPLSTR